jgi:hypothetical protein
VPEKKKQHFLPQLDLRNFSDAERKNVSAYVIEKGRHLHAVHIKDQGSRDYNYGKEGFEDILGKVESDAASVIQGVISRREIPGKDDHERDLLLKFLLFQDARTPDTRTL